MREIGKEIEKMDKDSIYISQLVRNMMGIGLMEKNMEKVHTFMHMEINMLEIGKMEKNVEKVYQNMQMDPNMMEDLKMIKQMVTGLWFTQMVINLKETGSVA